MSRCRGCEANVVLGCCNFCDERPKILFGFFSTLAEKGVLAGLGRLGCSFQFFQSLFMNRIFSSSSKAFANKNTQSWGSRSDLKPWSSVLYRRQELSPVRIGPTEKNLIYSRSNTSVLLHGTFILVFKS